MAEQHLEPTGDHTSHPMELLLAEDLNLPTVGEIRTGWVVSHRNNEILVDIGAKSEGLILAQEIDSLSKDNLKTLAVGNEVEVCIIDPEDSNGNMILSYAKAIEEKDWEEATRLLDSQEVCQSNVVGFNRGGILSQMGFIQAFIPNSQLARNHQARRGEDPAPQFKTLQGKTITAKVLEVDRKRNRLILSERAAQQEIRKAQKSKLLAELKKGDVRQGRVVNLADFGAFVDIGGIEGLVHLSELSWKRINKPADLLKVGDSVEVFVLNIDEEKQRLALSLKRLQPDPWTQIQNFYQEGQLVEATVTKLTKFGAFARLNDEHELIGLVHISEMAEEHVAHPREIVKPGDSVTTRIIRIDPEQRQLGLSMKKVHSDQYLEADVEIMSQFEAAN
ncbi:MAG: 30S ribosomal protein S1 [Anaerolineae bacterium]